MTPLTHSTQGQDSTLTDLQQQDKEGGRARGRRCRNTAEHSTPQGSTAEMQVRQKHSTDMQQEEKGGVWGGGGGVSVGHTAQHSTARHVVSVIVLLPFHP